MLTLDDVLSIRHPHPPRFSPDGAWLGFTYTVDGRSELWAVPSSGGEAVRLSREGQETKAWDWLTGDVAVWAEGGTVLQASPSGTPSVLLQGSDPVVGLAAGPGGSHMALVRGGKLAVVRVAGGGGDGRSGNGAAGGGGDGRSGNGVAGGGGDERSGNGAAGGAGAAYIEAQVPGAAAMPVQWSPDGTKLACLAIAGTQGDAAVVSAAEGSLLYQTDTPDFEHGLTWVGSDDLLVVSLSMDSQRRDYTLVRVSDGTTRLLEREESEKGLMLGPRPVGRAQGGIAALLVPADGWPHLVVHDIAAGTRTVVLPGEHEDSGGTLDEPAFSPDGRYIAFSSSKGNLQQRQLWRHDLQTGETVQLTDTPGTQTNPVWSPDGKRLAFITCGPHHSAEVAVIPADGGKPQRLTRSMPPAWTEQTTVAPQHIVLPGADGIDAHADLFLPHGFDPARKYPAIVYIHGGPTRQMRYGWHPMGPYAAFYSFNQYLLHKGYVVLSVDYRGGLGYGVVFEQANYMKFAQTELEDCVNGARYLKQLPYVDADSIAIYGLSYGGYMALAALTKYPDEFALGLNIAGIWDFEQWAEWASKQAPFVPNPFIPRWGGPKGPHNEQAYSEMSPRNFAANLKKPLLNMHGTKDEAVDFAQLDAIIRDLTRLGKDFAALYYPDETHFFRHRHTWADAFQRIEAAFARYLQTPAEKRPRAML